MTNKNLYLKPFTSYINLVIALLLLNASSLMAQQTINFNVLQQTKQPIDAATIIILIRKQGK